MNYQIIIPESVYLELKETASYYEYKQKGLGLKFVQNWEVTMTHLKTAPLLYQRKNTKLRTIRINKFPYLLVFEVVADKIYIYRLIHAKRNLNKIFKK
jgi:hypothetical protein